ncbi:NTP pyrophosphatase (non-canonical NTP hydrolase) [Isoptericola sp. CG 20/1183]|uniref:NTP pyrophosphatase (Non-canonical NTP hydrolase) n=2 Tax=Promicromonosporaceae TaxID=85017 RepID=A0ABX5EEQ2_9MICO|nr:NTP pyrophosphatase (non-canonical NTP hydrolase) [Isoptericola halotolerans]PRZ07298.1 NTP pyrophosphatase (non-canonical NTP hydrolase) [Isoptericola sp. CG 20/1183]
MIDTMDDAQDGPAGGPTTLGALADEVEIISRVYERRFGVPRSDDWLVLKLHEEVGELTQAYLARSGRSRDRGAGAGAVDAAFRSELADVLAQLLLVARRFDVDLEAELERKWFRFRHLVEPQDEDGVRR